jgi:hypothetical protein
VRRGWKCPNSHTASENSVPLSQFEQTGPDHPFNLFGMVERWLIRLAAGELIGFLVAVGWMLAG